MQLPLMHESPAQQLPGRPQEPPMGSQVLERQVPETMSEHV